MAFSTETIGKLWASGRNYASMIVGFIGGVGIISAAQSKGLTDSLNEIFSGVNQIVHGATSLWGILVAAFPILAVLFAKLASNSASTTNQAAAVQAAIKDPNTAVSVETKASVLDAALAIPEVKTPVITVSDPVLASITPNANVVVK